MKNGQYSFPTTRGDRWTKRIYIGLPGLVIIAIGVAIALTLLSGG